MEHEYYTGLSLVLMVAYATKKFGPSIGAWLDKEVDVSVSQRFAFLTKITASGLAQFYQSMRRDWRVEKNIALADADPPVKKDHSASGVAQICR